MTTTLSTHPANLTRQSPDLVAKFIRERRYHLIPLYWLLRQSDLAREGIENSGSYRFADHLYENIPKGRGWLGRRLDAILLDLPAARGMRERYYQSRRAMFEALAGVGESEQFHLLTIPCGLPRDVRDFIAALNGRDPSPLNRIQYTGIDLDPRVITAAHAFLHNLPSANFQIGNALDPATFPSDPPHLISSTGLGEFLDDTNLLQFYRNVFDVLRPGGQFFTSATACEHRADFLLRAFELQTHYRTRDQAAALLAHQPWASIQLSQDPTGLQTFILATKPR